MIGGANNFQRAACAITERDLRIRLGLCVSCEILMRSASERSASSAVSRRAAWLRSSFEPNDYLSTAQPAAESLLARSALTNRSDARRKSDRTSDAMALRKQRK